MAITGFEQFLIVFAASFLTWYLFSNGFLDFVSKRSAPDEKDFVPAPVNITTFISSSDSIFAIAFIRPSRIALFIALRFSGRLSVIVTTPFFTINLRSILLSYSFLLTIIFFLSASI